MNFNQFKNKIDKMKDNLVTEILCNLAVILFQFIRTFYYCKCINYPKQQCMFALWHAHQCGVYSCNVNKKTIIMVSSSSDGEIISRAANSVGVETVRGSKTRGGAKASLEMLRKMKEEGYNGALTVDGPKGPKRIVKKGIIDIARMAGVPIVPAVWWSPQKLFLKFNSWDEFRYPLTGTKLVMLFGDPIEIPSEMNNEEIEDKMNELYIDIKKNYYKYLKGE